MARSFFAMRSRYCYLLFWGFLCSLTSCQKYYVSVNQQWIDARYLASTHAHTPDPRQSHPPVGQMLVVDWRIPQKILDQNPYIQLHVIYWNYTEQTFNFPIYERMGWETYKLLNEEYDTSGGILTYRAELITENGELFRDWKHQLWVNLIQIEK